MVIWTKPARADLKHIHDFIAEGSKHYAKKVAQEIREKSNILNELSNVGKMVPEVGKPEIQELHIYSYRGLCTRLKTSNVMCWQLFTNDGISRQKIYPNLDTKKPSDLSTRRFSITISTQISPEPQQNNK